MRVNQKGFSMMAALSLAVVLGVGFMFLGKILSYVKSKKLQTQARVSAMGYEDSLISVLVPRIVGVLGNCTNVDLSDLEVVKVPGTDVDLRFTEVKPNNPGSTSPSSLSVNTTTMTVKADINAGQPMVDRGPQFIDNPADILFRLDFLDSGMSQDQKIFGPFMGCQNFLALDPPARRQIKVSYGINWNYRNKPMSLSGSKFVNLEELGL